MNKTEEKREKKENHENNLGHIKNNKEKIYRKGQTESKRIISPLQLFTPASSNAG